MSDVDIPDEAVYVKGITEQQARDIELCAGALLRLPSDRARRRVLAFVADVEDEAHND